MDSVSSVTSTSSTPEVSLKTKSLLIGVYGGLFFFAMACFFVESWQGFTFGIIGAILCGAILAAMAWFWFYARTLPGGRGSHRHTLRLAWCVLTNMGSRDSYTD